MSVEHGVDLTTVIVALINTAGLVIVGALGARIHRQIRTPSGKPLGEVVEYAHDTVIANNLLLSNKNGSTKRASKDELRDLGSAPPLVPTDIQPEPEEEGT